MSAGEPQINSGSRASEVVLIDLSSTTATGS
jgi:hypothetical protein